MKPAIAVWSLTQTSTFERDETPPVVRMVGEGGSRLDEVRAVAGLMRATA